MTGIEKISQERDKQIAKGYTPGHDAAYTGKELVYSALAYINAALYGESVGDKDWPFEKEYYKYEGYVESLKKAGAFIAAELDRLNVI